MGVVIRQSFWTSIVAYVGVAFGYLNSLILFPLFLDTEQIGLIRQLQAAALLLVPVATLGISNVMVKFHPQYSTSKTDRNSFLTIMLFGALIGFAASWIAIIIFNTPILEFFSRKSGLVIDYFYVIIALLFILTLTTVFRTYLLARLEIVASNFINGVLIRILVGVSILLYGFHLVNFDFTVNFLILVYAIALILHIVFAFRKEAFSFRIGKEFLDRLSLKELSTYSLFSILGSASNVIVLNVDILMVTGLAGLGETGIYTTAFYIAIVIDMPRRAISQISTPILSKALSDNDLIKVKQHYKSVSTNQAIIGGLLFLGLIGNLDNIYSLIPNKESFIEGMPVVMFIALAKVSDMIFSQNSEILMLSKHYKFNVITVVILGILTVIFNYLLIPEYGITGAAIASLISILLFNLVKFVYIKVKLGFHPFSKSTLPLLLWIAIVYLSIEQIPFLGNVFIDLLARSVLITLIFLAPVYALRVSPEINNTIKDLLQKVRNTF